MRKGLGKGKGKGYKNIIPKDPRVHSQSAKGMKQPQRTRLFYLQAQENKLKVTDKLKNKSYGELRKEGINLTYQGDKDGDGVANIKDCQPLNPKKQDNGFLKKAGGKIVSVSKKGLEKIKESKQKRKEEELEEIKHPKFAKLERQKKRIAELKRQLSIRDSDSLRNELEVEQDQLRDIQEEISNISLSEYSDKQLKTLAIRHQDTGFFNVFGSGNPYKDELLRRIRERKDLDQEIREAKKVKPNEDSFF